MVGIVLYQIAAWVILYLTLSHLLLALTPQEIREYRRPRRAWRCFSSGALVGIGTLVLCRYFGLSFWYGFWPVAAGILLLIVLMGRPSRLLTLVVEIDAKVGSEGYDRLQLGLRTDMRFRTRRLSPDVFERARTLQVLKEFISREAETLRGVDRVVLATRRPPDDDFVEVMRWLWRQTGIPVARFIRLEELEPRETAPV